MKIIYQLILFSAIFSLFHCLNEKSEEGNIMLLMQGSKLEINLEGKKLGNKNYYTIPLKVGTPPKAFNVQIDTSTSTSWLPLINCKNCDSCTKFYDPLESKTSSVISQQKIELDDEDGNVEGYPINDNVVLNGYNLQNFSFVQVTKFDKEFRDHYDGKLGLGYRDQHGKNFNFLDRLKKQNLITKKIFSINQMSEQKGLLFIGDNSANKYTFCNVSSGEDLDDIYKESWVCELTHVGIFNTKEGISNVLSNYTHISDGKVDFDSAYEYIAVPVSDRKIIEELLEKANLVCETDEDIEKKYQELSKGKKDELINKYNDEEINIKCKTTKEELKQKELCLSFILQGNVYSIPLETLFSSTEEKDKMEMKIKYIDDDDAIWTFGFPFMSQFLMVFNMEENHVGIKSIKKTSLPIVNITKQWETWNEHTNNFFYKKIDITLIIIISSILFITLIIIVVCLVFRAFRKSELRKSIEMQRELNNINAEENKEQVY
jgi:hypothetical protein